VQNTSGDIFGMEKGDRIAQFILARSPMIEWKVVEDISEHEGDRGGGFGSSGK
ncbi:MAG: dUTP diphosphatase, partial [Candidatus Aenigmatarchaeota archaeon]